MDLRQLECFLAVAEHLSFTRGAEALHMTQPSVSQQVRSLEDELGVTLFDRMDSRSVRLTHAGERLRVKARAILLDTAEAAREARSLHQEVRGPLVLGTLGTVAAYLLPGLLPGFMQRYPEADITFREEGNEALYQSVHRGELDLAFVVVREASEVETIPVVTDEVLLGVPAGHRLAGRSRAALSECRDERFILFQRGYALRNMAERACQSAGFAPRVAFESRELETIRALVAAGMGVTFLPRISLQGDSHPGVRAIPVDPPLNRSLGLIRHPRRYLTPVAGAWIDWCRDHLSSAR